MYGKKTKVLFLIHDLSVGGAEKVLVNLVNNMDSSKFDITVMTLFDGGVNKQFLKSNIKYKSCFKHTFRGNSHIMKLLSPKQLHKWLIRDKYDIEISYLEGPSARIISGCLDKDTKLVTWIHTQLKTPQNASRSFRTLKESLNCYSRYDKIVCVSETIKDDFLNLFQSDDNKVCVLYNTNESDKIKSLAKEEINDISFNNDEINIIGVGKIVPNKGFDRLAKIHKKLKDERFLVHTYILGVGNQKDKIEKYLIENKIYDSFTFLGYQTNPYKYVAKADIFVCSSHTEGFSTAATEALIVGTPVVTTRVSGMEEMLGKDNEFGIICSNDDLELYESIKILVDNENLRNYYKEQSFKRGNLFSTENTVKEVEKMLDSL